ncbi:Hemicentin-1,Coadhesin,Mucin-like protein,Receptor-type tyrosine-protein phosphatase gamma,Tyrosine-protein phosphatase non-receptor type 13,Properdin [Mytilus edulis]|uniref:protein-tyrosine-phosphatase n=1 Tax=Mytilus edulis TaxID=6550 RepID=A0A8S3QGP7_MYTED|nr:Hemicentin-1,Coadhesin,Mucin-like protein,Receptor-type tyrosine-protein phosphatase gamma,Tyrosine-protein phosphatase non-receptor type 13,Properdin [Mytilus edulis]
MCYITVQASIGSSVTLTCTVYGAPLYWYKIGDHGAKTLGDNGEYEGSRTNSLKIKYMTVNTAAIHFCQLTNGKKGTDITVSILVNGGWSAWYTSGSCTVSCGGGSQPGVRYCNNPPPANCGLNCDGKYNDNIPCSPSACPVNGGWSLWGSWGDCTLTCGTEQQSRSRTCDNPAPANNGADCQDPEYEYKSCLLPACPVDGGWSLWGSWGVCNVTCGTGQQSRRRICDSPAPENGGANCQGEEYDYNLCTQPTCPVNGGWSSWISGACNATCGTGYQSRNRYCNNPSKANGGADCQGEGDDLILCSLSACAESSAATGPVAPIAGGIGGGIVLIVIVVIVLIYMKRRRRKPLDDRVSGENQALQIVDRNVSLRQGGERQEGMYINIARASRQSSSDTDDVIPSRLSTKEPGTDDSNTYYNSFEILTTVKIEELKDYIKRKQVNEGLHSEYKTIPYGPQHQTTIAQKKENMPKNRFKTTFPYDHTRVILQPTPGSPHTDYINANLVDGFEKESCYIASQGPFKHTSTDFWAMIWQNNSRKIIMLTNLMEVAKVKCDKYWPEGGKPMVLGNLIITLQTEKERAAYVTREISVEDKKTKEKRNIIQYHFTAWPDHGTPDPLYLVLFHRHVISDHSDVESGKLLVHCRLYGFQRDMISDRSASAFNDSSF